MSFANPVTPTFPLVSKEDWLFGGVVTQDKGYVFTSRQELVVDAAGSRQERPGMTYYDQDLEMEWNYQLPVNGVYHITGGATLSPGGGEVHTRVIEVADGYVAFGVDRSTGKDHPICLKLVKSGTTTELFTRIGISNLGTGIYFLKLEQNGILQTERVIIQ